MPHSADDQSPGPQTNGTKKLDDAKESSSMATRGLTWLEEHWALVVGVLSALTAIAVASIAGLSDGTSSFLDESAYQSLSSNLAQMNWYSLDGMTTTAYRPPGFPVALSFVARVHDDLTFLRGANALLAGLVVFLGARLARRISGNLTAVLVAVVLTLSPVAVYTATKLYPQTLAAVLLIASLSALIAAESTTKGRPRIWWSAAAGLLFAALTLTVPNYAVTLLVGAAWLFWRLRREAIVPLLVLAFAFSLPMAAWAVRNHAVFDEVVPISTNGGINLLLGNTEGAGAGTGVNVDVSEFIDEANRRDLDEVERDRMYRNEGLSWIREHPARAGRLYVSKVLNTFSVQQQLATESEEPSPAATLVIAVTYLPVLLLFLIRPFVFRRVPLRKGEGLLLLAFWSNVAVTAIAFTRIRFRVPIDPLMVIVAATFLTSMLASSHLSGDSSSEEANTTQPDGVLGQ